MPEDATPPQPRYAHDGTLLPDEEPEPEIDWEALIAGGVVPIDVTPHDFGRIAAQTAKQVILQRIREAEREMMFEEYQDRVGDIVTGIVQQSDSRYCLVDLGKVEALLPGSEQVPNERYEHGARIKAVIIDVRSGTKGPQIVLSRRSEALIRELFELEVPEIADGLVVIRAVAREPGYRSKIAVESRVQGVDPVGACVGPRGSRVRMVVSELRGEKIDIIPWNDEPARFIAKALAPARVKEVLVDDEEQQATIIVPDGELSLAIGREGQNARLAAKLTGWRVDIKSESEFLAESDEDYADASNLAKYLEDRGYPGEAHEGDAQGGPRVDQRHRRPPLRAPRRAGGRGRGRRGERLTAAAAGSTPHRQCVACGARRPQAALVRIRHEATRLVLGPGPGRSAYVCAEQACVERALARGLVGRRLRAPDAADDALRRLAAGAGLTEPNEPHC